MEVWISSTVEFNDLIVPRYNLRAYCEDELIYDYTSDMQGKIFSTEEKKCLWPNNIKSICNFSEDAKIAEVQINVEKATSWKLRSQIKTMLDSIFDGLNVVIPVIVINCDQELIEDFICYWKDGTRRTFIISTDITLTYKRLHDLIKRMQEEKIHNAVLQFHENVVIDRELMKSKLWETFNSYNEEIKKGVDSGWENYELLYKF